ncbi:hypothetical protein D9M68_816770 [compost metagenome]
MSAVEATGSDRPPSLADEKMRSGMDCSPRGLEPDKMLLVTIPAMYCDLSMV